MKHNYAGEDFIIADGRLIDYRGKDEKVIIPDGVKIIGEHSLSRKVVKIYLPGSVEKLEKDAFDYAEYLEEIEVADDNHYLYSRGDCLIERETKKLIMGTRNSIIPSDGSVTSIAEGAFYGIDSARFFIPKCITTIESRAFGGNTEVTLSIEAETKPEGWADDWDSGIGEQWDEVWWESGGADLILEWGSKPGEE